MQRLLERRCLLEGGAYFNVDAQGAAVVRGRHLFDAQHLLEEILYMTY